MKTESPTNSCKVTKEPSTLKAIITIKGEGSTDQQPLRKTTRINFAPNLIHGEASPTPPMRNQKNLGNSKPDGTTSTFKKRSESPLLKHGTLSSLPPKSPTSPCSPSRETETATLFKQKDIKRSLEKDVDGAIRPFQQKQNSVSSIHSNSPTISDTSLKLDMNDSTKHIESGEGSQPKQFLRASSLTNIETEAPTSSARSQLHSSKDGSLDITVDTVVNSCNQYLDDNRTVAIKIERENSRPDDIEVEKEKKESVIRFIPVVIDENYYAKQPSSEINQTPPLKTPKKLFTLDLEKTNNPIERGSSSYGTLPHVLRRQQKHVRSLIVPKMRKMFEKSKSAEPEGSSAVPSRTVRLKIQIDPPKSPLSNRNNEELSNTRKDGTESVNSFLAVDKDLLEVVDRKRKTLPGERHRSASFSSNGDEWSLSEGYDQTPEDGAADGTSPANFRVQSSNDPLSNQRYPRNGIGLDNRLNNNCESFSEKELDKSSSSSSTENNANVLNNKSFVNKCVSKVKNLVNSKQGSPQPGQ